MTTSIIVIISIYVLIAGFYTALSVIFAKEPFNFLKSLICGIFWLPLLILIQLKFIKPF